MRIFTLLLLAAIESYAAAITSTQTGNWNSGSTWVGGVAPGNGDTAIIANGHTVTIPTGITVTVGTSPANDSSTPAIACSSSSGTGVLVISGTLIYRGSIRQCAGWSAGTTGPGVHVQHDSSLGSGTPSYTWQWPSGCGTTCWLSLNGTAGSHITWDTAVGSGVAGYIGAALSSGDNGQLTAAYVDWSNIGSASAYAIQATLHSAGAKFVIQNSTCTACGQVAIWEDVDGAVLSFDKFVLSSVSGVTNSVYIRMDTALTTGKREFINSYVENGQVYLLCSTQFAPHLQFHGNTLYHTASLISGYSTPCVFSGSEWADNLMWINATTASSGGSVLPGGTFSRTFHLGSNTQSCSGENFHLANLANTDSTIDTWIIEPDCDTNSTFGGKGILTQGLPGSVAYNLRITNSLALPATAGLGGIAGSGSTGPSIPLMWNAIGSCDGVTTFCGNYQVDHNTAYATDAAALFYSEGTVTQPVLLEYAKDNLIWRNSSGPSARVNYIASVPNGGLHGVGYNWAYNDNGAGAQYHTAGGNVEYSSPSTPGTGDTTGNPQFVDSTRNFIKWCQTLNAADTTWAGCLAHFKSIDAASTGYTPRALMDWTLAGFVPQNSATATAGSTGGQVGAVRYAPVYPVMLYTDLDSGPKTGGVNDNGVFITVSGKRFGSTQGAITLGGQAVVVTSWSDTSIVFQPGSSAVTGRNTIAVTRSDGEGAPCYQAGNCDFTVRSGDVFCVSNSGSDSNNGKFTTATGGTGCWQGMEYALQRLFPGDTLYFGSGPSDTFQMAPNDLLCGSLSRADIWIAPSFNNHGLPCGRAGTEGNPIAIAGYPGNTATIGGSDETQYAMEGIETQFGLGYWTFANLKFIGSQYYYNNGNVIATQGKGFRGVNLDLQLPLAPLSFEGLLNPTSTGATAFDGIVNRWYGNYLHNLGVGGTIGDTSNDNSKHSAMIYQGTDGNEQEFAWNVIDATPAPGVGGVNRCYHNHSSPGTGPGNPIFGVSVHDNIFTGCSGNTFDMTVDPGRGSGVEFYNNLIYGNGTCQNWVGARYGYAFFGIEVAEDGYDFNWLPQSGLLKFWNNTFYDLNSNACLADGTSSGLFIGPDGGNWSGGLTAPPPPVTICASSCTASTYSGTLPPTDYAPYYFPYGVVFATNSGSTPNPNAENVVDDGSGNLTQEGQIIGTIDYTTGAYSFTFLRTPPVGCTISYFSIWSYRVDLKNNIIHLKTGEPIYWSYGGGSQLFNLDHNLFYNEAGTGSGMQLAWPYKVTNQIGSNSDPLFTSASTGDFRLLTSSPAIASGTMVGIPRDFDGYPRVKSDVGAFIFTGLASPSVSPTAGALTTGTVGGSYSRALTASNFSSTVTWSLVSGSLPAGLSGCTSGTGTTCSITGTPSTASGSPFSFTIRASDGSTDVDTAYTITINAAPTITNSGALTAGTQSSAYSQALTTSGGTGSLTCTVVTGALPTGLSFSACTITGTPTVANVYTFTAHATDGNSVTGSTSSSLSITINSSGGGSGGAKKGGKSASGGKIRH